MEFRVFGYKITKGDTAKVSKGVEKVTTPLPDGSAEYEVARAMDANSYAFDFEVEIKKEAELIDTYRSSARLPDVDSAIDDIINEAIVVELENPAVELAFGEDCKFSAGIKTKIGEEFTSLLAMMEFDINGPQMFRQWYIDGKHYYHKVIDSNKKSEGIQELNWLDPARIKKVRENITEVDNAGNLRITGYNEFYIFDPNSKRTKKSSGVIPARKNVLRLEPDAVSYANSGLIDLETGRALSYLHKAVKPANQLSLLEDSMVVYRLSRAPERRIFYIDVGNLPKARAEQYMQSIINKYKNKLAYDVQTGTVKANKHHLSMLEDIWLPRKEGGKGTEVSSLEGGTNLGEIEDVVYFQKKLYKSLNLPTTRLDSESSFVLGNSGEISRDEIKFSKFIFKMRGRFNMFFLDLLKTQLILKNKITEAEWEKEKANFEFIYNVDSHFAEIKQGEVMANRLEQLGAVDPYVGRYFSITWVRREILHQTEDDIKSIDKEMEEEKAKADAGETEDPAFGGMEVATQPEELPPEEVEGGAPPAAEPAEAGTPKPAPKPKAGKDADEPATTKKPAKKKPAAKKKPVGKDQDGFPTT
jgi:hypothetical protein